MDEVCRLFQKCPAKTHQLPLPPPETKTTESKPVEETEEDEEESVVDPLGSRLMKIYTPAKQMTRLERPKLGKRFVPKNLLQ